MAKDMPVYPGLERWRLLYPIGKGAFSAVYRAQDTQTAPQTSNDDVAIKIMRKSDMTSQQVRTISETHCEDLSFISQSLLIEQNSRILSCARKLKQCAK
jgi:serine/threonine protein kinase